MRRACPLKQRLHVLLREVAERAQRGRGAVIGKKLLFKGAHIVPAAVLEAGAVPHAAELEAEVPVQFNLFDDIAAQEQQHKDEETKLERERKIQEAMLGIKKKFGKNAILNGGSYLDGATARERNGQIGGHKA